MDEGREALGDVGQVFLDFAWRTKTARFLATPEGINWRTSFPLPHREGRLHATLQNATRTSDRQPVLIFELTARGMDQDSSREAMWRWFDLAREWIGRIYRFNRSGYTTTHVGAKEMTLQATTTTQKEFSNVQAPIWLNSPTTTTYTQEQSYTVRGDVPEKTDVILLSSEGGTRGAAVKWRWRPSRGAQLPAMRYFFRFIEHIGLPGDTAASVISRSELRQRPEPDTRVWRGVFSPPYRRKELFSQSVKLRTADLPKWKPHITIDRRTRMRAEDE